MPLLDHFHPPLSEHRSWESLHAAWCVALVEALNDRWLPREYFAEVQTHPDALVEVDVATYRESMPAHGNGAGTATLAPPWSPPAPQAAWPAVFPDTFEVRVIASERGNKLVAVIELVSPSNKDRPETRRAFTMKAATYLAQGVSLVIVDVVTSRKANLHQELESLLEVPSPAALEGPIYAAAYRPVMRKDKPEVDVWTEQLAIGAALPVMPLRLSDDLFVPVNLESTYVETCRRLRLA